MQIQPKQRLRFGLAFGLSLSLILFAALPVFDLTASTKDVINSDRGDNPVVGSLPCYEDDALDLMFWRGLGHSEPNIKVFAHRPTLGFLGSDDLSERILAANGMPFGIVNRDFGYSAFAVERQAVVEFWVADILRGDVAVWQWLPREYFGARLLIAGPNFNLDTTITTSCIELPLRELLASVPSLARTRLLIVPNAANVGVKPIEIIISNVGELLFVDYGF
ncbi:MAG: hypothetical protein HN405_02945 [Planctomycetes bacterium]|jgi:hypothetical protein|nr:hypothetical protein [Planctomycetota bacterium]MBT4560094.1 hypothetical protein [Planctomycetota bacterium]MBT7319130.1 hypothetical protein [Planctomycetota bacterium]